MSESLYTGADVPASQTQEVVTPTVGDVIVVAVDGTVSALKRYRPANAPSNPANVVYVLYNATTQAELARIPVPSESLGWNVAPITPVVVTAGTRLITTVYGADWYAYTSGGHNSVRVVGNLTSPATGTDPIGNGRFRSGADGYPNSTFGGNNYWTDLVFDATPNTTPVSKTVRVKWTVAQKVVATIRAKWPVLQKVSRALRIVWPVSSPPTPVPTPSTAMLRAQRDATMAFIRDDPTTAELIPVARVRTATGGYAEAPGAPRPAQTFKLSLLAFDAQPTITVAGVERIVSYHLIGPHDMQIATGDYWIDAAGTRYDVVGFTEGWDYMTKALISRHVPREAKA